MLTQRQNGKPVQGRRPPANAQNPSGATGKGGLDMAANVYFTREITPEAVVKLYHALGIELPGKVAVKVHSGEKGNQNFLRPEFWKPMVEEVQGTIVECNTAYGDAAGGVRDHTDRCV